MIVIKSKVTSKSLVTLKTFKVLQLSINQFVYKVQGLCHPKNM